MAKMMSTLTTQKRIEVRGQLFQNGDDQADLEMMRAHFESHPTMPGEKDFKKRVNQILDEPLTPSILTDEEKDWLADKWAETEIRETKYIGDGVVDMTKDPVKDSETGKISKFKEPEENKFQLTPIEGADNAYTLDVELRKVKDGVNIYAKTSPDAARFTKIGTVPDNFLINNPMNVSRCPAQICIEDYSDGKLRNVSERLVVESSRMSGDYVELSDDMLTSLDKTATLEQ